MPTRNVNLTEYYDTFVQEQIAAGRYKNASEVMRAGLRLLQTQTTEEEQKLHLLRSLAAEGLDSLDQGRGIAFRSKAQLGKHIASLGRKAAKCVVRKSR